MKLEFSRKIFEKMKNKYPSSGRRDVQTDLMKLVVGLYNFANAPKNDNFTGCGCGLDDQGWISGM